jgi:L-alanine-DL-glutamate epimerase-like enolase superfamily enzyme
MTATTIITAKAELWRYPLPGVTGGSGITEVDVIAVALEASTGETGMGFSYVLGGGGETVAATATRMLEKFVDATQQIPPPALWQRLAGSLNRLGRGTGYVAIGAIDLAAWDLWAKRQKITLAEALGGVPKPIKVYGSGGFGPTQAPEDAVRQALNYADHGCTAVKLRFAGNAADIDRLKAVAEALPAGVAVMGDANEKCDLVTAQWLANACADYNLMWLEEPLPAQDIVGYAALAAHSPVAIATGEHHQGLVELAPFLEAKSCAVVQPDLAMIGGITEAMRVATVAGHYGVGVAPHFLPALFVHLAAVAPAVTWLEHFPLLEPLFDNPVDLDDDGNISPSTEPGHGLRWAEDARDRYFVEG